MASNTRLISVKILYCLGNKQVELDVDLNKAGGLWWHDGKGKSKPKDYPPGTATRLNKHCDMPEVMGGGSTACWWDNVHNEWVCPDGLGS